jgi:hypothetical protein
MNPNDEARDRAGPEREERRRLLRRLVNFTPRELRDLWKLGAFAELDMGPRALLLALVARMNVDTLEAFPSHERLADEIGCSVRSVQTYVATLVELGIINEPRVLRVRGVLHYELGPAAYAGVREFVAGHASSRVVDLVAVERIEMLERENAILRELVASGEAAAVRIRCIPASVAGRRSRTETAASEVNSLSRSQTPSSSSAAREEENSISISEHDRCAARSALGELHAKKHPARPPRRAFDAAELELVARCSSTIAGDVDAKLEALRFAIAGAWHASNGPPSSRFIFGALEHFEQHVDAGARRARALERRPTSPPREAVARPLEDVEHVELDFALGLIAAAGMR